jgi:putative ABC transport system permease protein
MSRTPLAWRNLVHQKVTLVISAAAVAFAILIMFMEVGFLNGLYDSQTSVYQNLNGELVMLSRGLHILNTHEYFPLVRLEQASGFAGVKAAYPLYIEDLASDLRNPGNGIRNGIRVLAFDPNEPVFARSKFGDLIAKLQARMAILFDRKSRAFFGTFKNGTPTELADRAVTVAGNVDLGPDYYYDGNVLTSIDTFLTLFPHRQRDEVSVGVIQLERGASIKSVLRELRTLEPADVEILTKADLVAREKATWQKATPAGYVFTMGVVVGFIIGIFICYQILYTDIADHLPQLATMKALGYHNRDLVRLVLTQGILLGLIGFAPALVMTFGLYAILSAITGIVTKLTLARVILVLVLTVAMCFLAGAFAVRKALAADPAELF